MAAAQQEPVSEAAGAVLRGLDRLTGELQDLEIPSGGRVPFGRLDVSVEGCRFPSENPTGDAYAHVTIRDARAGEQLFSGWMVASSPALNALDNPRYDIWVLRCMTS